MEYVMRARCNRAVRSFTSVYFEKDRSSLRDRYEARPRLYLTKYIHILLYILYSLTLVGYLLFSFSRTEILKHQKYSYCLLLTISDSLKLKRLKREIVTVT